MLSAVSDREGVVCKNSITVNFAARACSFVDLMSFVEEQLFSPVKFRNGLILRKQAVYIYIRVYSIFAIQCYLA